MIIAVITEVEADSPRAHFVNVVKTAGGFSRLGHRVLLLCRAATGPVDIAGRYGEPDLEVVMAPGPTNGRPADRAWAFARWAAEEARARGAEFAYARSFCGAMASADAGLPTVMETHAHIGDPNPLLAAALEATARESRPIAGLVTISRRLAEHYASRGAERITVVPDGVDLDLFSPPAPLPGPNPLVAGHANILYSGHLYDEKGIPTLIDAAPILARERRAICVHLLGGLPEDIARARTRADAVAPGLVRTHGPVAHASVPRWLWHADCLVLPPSGRDPSANWTSPVKLGEYLAAGPPIVASAIPALRDWLDERVVRWFSPDDPDDLARAVRESLCESAERARVRRRRAMELAERFSYPARAAAILRAGGGPITAIGAASAAAS